jgi:hypothetical protein
MDDLATAEKPKQDNPHLAELYGYIEAKLVEHRKAKEQAEAELQKMYVERDALLKQKKGTIDQINGKKAELAAAEKTAADAAEENAKRIALSNAQIAEHERLKKAHDEREKELAKREKEADAVLKAASSKTEVLDKREAEVTRKEAEIARRYAKMKEAMS